MTEPETAKQPGVYLYFRDGSHLALPRAAIDAKARQVMEDPLRVPAEARAAPDFLPCSICPKRMTANHCHALGPAFAFLTELDQYVSHHRVTAVYRPPDSRHMWVAETTMQRALQYIAIICLMEYCEVGLKYSSFFKGVNPLKGPEQIARQVYANAAREFANDAQTLQHLIHHMQGEIRYTTRCQVKRLRLLSQSDSVINAFINALAVTDYLEMLQHDHDLENGAEPNQEMFGPRDPAVPVTG